MSSPSVSQSFSFFPFPFLFLHLYMHTKINICLIPEINRLEEYKNTNTWLLLSSEQQQNHARLLLSCELEHTALSVPQFPQWEIKSLDQMGRLSGVEE